MITRSVRPEALWMMMKCLKKGNRLLTSSSFPDVKETTEIRSSHGKKMESSCIRHSAITSDNDYPRLWSEEKGKIEYGFKVAI